jgi:hypothetical protein
VARDLILDVVARKNSRDLSTLADEFDRLAKETDDAGQKMHKTGTFSKFLQDELKQTRAEVKALGQEFEFTGNKDVFAKLRGAQSNLKSLEGIQKQLTSALVKGATDGGTEGGKGFTSAISGFLSTPVLGPLTAGALVAGAVLAAPAVGAVLGGALVGGAGISGLFAGALTQLKTNPEVQASARDFTDWLSAEWKAGTAAFAEPLQGAFSLLKTDLAGPIGDLKKDFAYLAPYVQQFATYLGAAVEKFMPGFNRMIQSSGPILTEMGRDLVIVADGLNTMFDEISKGSKGEVEALDTLARIIGGTLAATGFLIRGLSNAYDALIRVDDAVIKFVEDWASWTPMALFMKATGIDKYIDGIARSFDAGGVSVSGMARGLDHLTREADQQKAAVDALTGAWDKWFGLSMGVDQATLRYHQDLTQLSEAIQQNGRQWDLNTKSGQDNYGALLNAIQGAHDLRQAQIDSGAGADAANRAYQASVDKLLDMAGKAGLSKSEIAKLKAQVDGLRGSLESLDGKVVHYSVVGTTRGPGGKESGYYQGLATGGRIPGYAEGGGVIRVGEMGPEYLTLPSTAGPAYITPNSAINGAANTTGVGGQLRLTVDVRGGASGSADAALASWFMNGVRTGQIKVDLAQLAA